jgi:hypothetical protein
VLAGVVIAGLSAAALIDAGSSASAASSYSTAAYVAASRSGSAVYINALVKQGSASGVIVRSPGRTVYVQRHLPSGWQNMLVRTTDRAGVFTVGFVMSVDLTYRLVVLATPTALAATSATVATTGGISANGPTLAGCPLFPSSNPWRQDISHATLSPQSATWVSSVGAGGFLHPDFGSNPGYGIPYSVVPAGQPRVPVRFTAYGSESDPGPYPIPAGARIEAGGDAHVLVASGDCHLYELYGAARSGAGWTAASGAVFDLRSNALRPAGWTSADAAGLPLLPGLVRRDEVLAGRIDHALRFTVSRTQRGYISPATHQAGASTDPNLPPMGARFRLKASFDLTPYHGASRVILQALKTYGMFVADNGSNWYLSGATDTAWNDTDLDQLKGVPGSAFEVVDTGPVHTG